MLKSVSSHHTSTIVLCGAYNCNKQISARNCSIKCSHCMHFFHVKCSIKMREFESLQDKNIDWFCIECRDTIFHFNTIETTSELCKILYEDIFSNFPARNKKTKCIFCSKTIKQNMPASYCSHCLSYYHLKCSGHNKQKNPLPLNWQCTKCIIKTLPFSDTDDESLKLILHGFDETNINILTDNVPSFSLKSLLDKMPGQHFSTDDFLDDTIQSKYYTLADFIFAKFNKNKFSVFHINISSLQKHIHTLRARLASLQHQFDVICITETRLYDDKPLSNIEIDGYDFVHTPTSTTCGGVGMYINSHYEYDILKEFSKCHTNICESNFIELKHPSKRNIVIGTIYRHHTPVEDFVDIFLRKSIQKLTKSKKTCILTGDFNIDLTQYGVNRMVDTFYDEITSHSFRPLILQPSRATSHSLTLIDNIFVNEVSCQASGGNLTTSISDHFSQFTFLDIYNNHPLSTRKVKYGRNWRNFNSNEFKNELGKCFWDDVTSTNIYANASFSNFYHKIEKLIDEMAPMKKLTAKEIGLKQRPWITTGLLKSMSSRDKLYKDFVAEKDPLLRSEKFTSYKQKRNMVTTLLRRSKNDYYNMFFMEHKSNVKKTWLGIRDLISVTKKNKYKYS